MPRSLTLPFLRRFGVTASRPSPAQAVHVDSRLVSFLELLEARLYCSLHRDSRRLFFWEMRSFREQSSGPVASCGDFGDGNSNVITIPDLAEDGMMRWG